MSRTLLLLLCCAALPVGASWAQGTNAAAPQAPRDAASLLDQRLPEVALDNVPLEQVVDWLGELLQTNVIVRWQVLEDAGVERDQPISVKVRNLRLSQVLWLILNEAAGPDLKLAYRASNDMLIISTAEDFAKDMVVKVYDVSDLLYAPPDFHNAPQIDVVQVMNSSGTGNTTIFTTGTTSTNARTTEKTAEENIDTLVELITNTIEPDSWSVNNGQGYIQPYRNMLIVYNTLSVHQRISGALSDTTVGP